MPLPLCVDCLSGVGSYTTPTEVQSPKKDQFALLGDRILVLNLEPEFHKGASRTQQSSVLRS